MKTKTLLSMVACSVFALSGLHVKAQTMTIEEIAVVTEEPCKTHYYSDASDNWFMQLGAGATLPLVENNLTRGDAKSHFTAVYNVGFGKWCSPYVGWRLGFLGGSLHWDNAQFNSVKWVNANFDMMWDIFNTFGNVNPERIFSVVPFVGIGGAYTWDYSPSTSPNIRRDNGEKRTNSWTLPVSAGLQLRLRMSKYVDVFAEGRAQFFGDNFNNYSYGQPIDMNVSVIGGLSFTFGGVDFASYNPCTYGTYINTLNERVNDLRAELAITAAALSKAESKLPCPEVVEKVTVIKESPASLMATVRFSFDSSTVNESEMVNIYNVAQWMKDNPDEYITLVGYADKDTGTSDYNRALSQRRADAVYNILVNTYGINANRIEVNAAGSEVQPYDTNSWNRIVIFSNIK